MSRTPQERTRIEDEELRRYHEDAYRAQVARRLRENPPERKKRFTLAFAAGMVTLVVLSAAFSQAHIPAGATVAVAILGGALVFRRVL